MLLLLTYFNAEAQKSNERKKWVSCFDQDLILDSLTIVPGSIRPSVPGQQIDISHSIESGKVYIHADPSVDSILVEYKVFPYAMHQKVYNKNLDIYDSTAYFKTSARTPGKCWNLSPIIGQSCPLKISFQKMPVLICPIDKDCPPWLINLPSFRIEKYYN